jgi:urease accessory protein
MIHTNIYPNPDWIVGKTALMNVRAHKVNGKTIIQPSSWRIPFQWQGYHYQNQDDQPYMLMLNSGGGYVEGDGSYFFGHLEKDTRALFTTTASGKFYKCLNGLESTEVVEFNVGENALLEYFPDEAIPFANSRSRRSIKINMQTSSRLFATDMVSAGRVHYGKEIFKFDSLRSSFEVMLKGKRLAQDKVIVKTNEEVADLERLWKGARHSAVIFAYAPDLPKDIDDHVRKMANNVDQTAVGVSRIGDLVTIRILSHETWQAHEAIYKCWQALRPAIAGKDARPIMKC